MVYRSGSGSASISTTNTEKINLKQTHTHTHTLLGSSRCTKYKGAQRKNIQQ